MRYTTDLENTLVATIGEHPASHIVFDPEDYRADGRIMIYRDNLGQTLQVRLFTILIGTVPRGWYLRRTCPDARCVNPHHFSLTKTTRARPEFCPNGHRYTPANTLPDGRARCRSCYEARLARRRKTGRKFGYCRNGHELTEDNVYTFTDVRGRVHRRCKTCHLERVRAKRIGSHNTTGEQS